MMSMLNHADTLTFSRLVHRSHKSRRLQQRLQPVPMLGLLRRRKSSNCSNLPRQPLQGLKDTAPFHLLLIRLRHPLEAKVHRRLQSCTLRLLQPCEMTVNKRSRHLPRRRFNSLWQHRRSQERCLVTKQLKKKRQL